jgi:hypothetical protein
MAPTSVAEHEAMTARRESKTVYLMFCFANPKTAKSNYYQCMTSAKQPPPLDVAAYLHAHGEKGLFDFLYSAQPISPREKVYSVHYGENYGNYARNFDADKHLARRFITKWAQSGQRRDDI